MLRHLATPLSILITQIIQMTLTRQADAFILHPRSLIKHSYYPPMSKHRKMDKDTISLNMTHYHLPFHISQPVQKSSEHRSISSPPQASSILKPHHPQIPHSSGETALLNKADPSVYIYISDISTPVALMDVSRVLKRVGWHGMRCQGGGNWEDRVIPLSTPIAREIYLVLDWVGWHG